MPKYGFEQISFQSKRIRALFVVMFLIMIAVWAMVLSPESGTLGTGAMNEHLRLDFVNVGQGDAILIRTPRGRTYLVDGGTDIPQTQAKRENRELIQDYLRTKRIRHLDGIVITHPHNDHLGGIVPVLRQFKVERIWDDGVVSNTKTYIDYVNLCQKKRIPREAAKAGMTLDWGPELHVVVLHPEKILAPSQTDSGVNNISVVLQIRYGKVSVLLCGDIESDAEAEIARYGEALHSQIVKIPHHGSDTSLNKTFWEFVKPRLGVIQVGRDNPFGHPQISALDFYRKLGITLKRTDINGTVRIEIGGERLDDYSVEVDRIF